MADRRRSLVMINECSDLGLVIYSPEDIVVEMASVLLWQAFRSCTGEEQMDVRGGALRCAFTSEQVTPSAPARRTYGLGVQSQSLSARHRF